MEQEHVDPSVWIRCVRALEAELPEQQFNTWVRPLQVLEGAGALKLLAPNRFVVEWVNANLLPRIGELLQDQSAGDAPIITVEVGSRTPPPKAPAPSTVPARARRAEGLVIGGRLDPHFSFSSFVQGKSNQLAKAAAVQVAENLGRAYNPLFLYGGVGLGKTHLMHAIANHAQARDGEARVAYVHSERFVSDMVRGLQHNKMNEFKTAYRSLDALLIDDIQFFAGKDRSQEEFFHTFNELLEGQHQVILTCDRYPKEVEGLEERLKSRFGWGLTVAIEPPELETCVAILMTKAQSVGVKLARGGGVLHRQAHPFERARARRCAAPGDCQLVLHRPCHHRRIHQGSAEGSALPAGEARDDRQHSENRRGLLQAARGGSALQAPQPLGRAAAAGGDGPCQGAHHAQSAGNRRCIWRP
jgi:chromosomal replication initiator protein